MKILRRIKDALFITFGAVACSSRALAQSTPPLPPTPPGYITGHWNFDDTNSWSGPANFAPLSFSNIVGVPSWEGNALWVDSTAPAWLQYPVVEPAGHTNLVCAQGTLSVWVWPDWTSGSLGGTGPSDWGRIVDVGQYSTNANLGWLGLYFSPDGNSLIFSGQSNGYGADFVSAPIAWDNSGWHLVCITWSPTNSAIYLDGQLASTNGTGAVYCPGPAMLVTGFFVGSDTGTGSEQVRGVLDELRIWNYPLDSGSISNIYAAESGQVWPTPTGSGDGSLGLDGGINGSDGIGFPGSGSNGGFAPDFNSGGSGTPQMSCPPGSLCLEIWQPGTNIFNSDSNSVTLILHGTTNDNSTTYQLVSSTNLGAGWTVEQTFLGSPGQDWTPLTVSIADRPTLFFRARNSGLDTDGDGLPDWWELKYGLDPNNPDTGNTGIPDGYKTDGIGDGYTYLQKYQMGIAPNVWATPQAPSNVRVSVDPVTSAVIITWSPASGAVTGYTVTREDDDGYSQSATVFTVGLTNELVDTNYPPYLGPLAHPSDYSVVANYTNGDTSTYGDGGYINPQPLDLVPYILSSVDGSAVVATSYIPSGVVKLRLTLYDPNDLFSPLTNMDVSVNSLMDGSITLSSTSFPYDPNGIDWYMQGVPASGQPSLETAFLGYTWPANYDGSTELNENASFLLRAASLTAPFVGAPTTTTQDVLAIFDSDEERSAFELPWRPFYENYNYWNFVFASTNVDSTGYLNTGCQGSSASDFSLQDMPAFSFTPPTSAAPIGSMLTASQTRWMLPYSNWKDLGIQQVGTNFFLPGNITNFYGLRLLSVMLVYSIAGNPLNFQELDAGNSLPVPSADTMFFYPEFDQPQFQTEDYYVVDHDVGLEPDSPLFPSTNPPTILVAGVGQPLPVGAYAVQTVMNGDRTKPVYVQQYFDKAFRADANGQPTSTPTGILSPNGTFVPTEVGQAVLLTKPDAATGSRGQCLVTAIKTVVDVNHDGIMDLSFAGPDSTDSDHRYEFWINNNFDRLAPDTDDSTNYNDDVKVAGSPADPRGIAPDYAYAASVLGRQDPILEIPCQRDLQDYARIWFVGVSNALEALPFGSTATIDWEDSYGGQPSMNLFPAADVDGGMRYLTNANVGAIQIDPTHCPSVGTVGPGFGPSRGLVFSQDPLTGQAWPGDHFIFCGAAAGSGRLTLTLKNQFGQVLAQSGVYIHLQDIKQMYERWTVGDAPSLPPANHAYLASEGLDSPFSYGAPLDTNTPYILYVHGWNMAQWEKDRFAESAFKRLYWQGYQGRFGIFRWPTDYGFAGISSLATNVNEKDNYDSSEFQAWRSGIGLLNKLDDLNVEYPGHIYLLAHSMGNIVAGEALRLSSKRVVDTYVASQAAVSAHTYDAGVPVYSFSFGGISFGPNTPNIYGAWFAGNYGIGAGSIVSFYNTNDFALARSRWQLNQLLKPDQSVVANGITWTYGYTGSPNDGPPWNNFIKQSPGGGYVAFSITSNPGAVYEVMSYAAQAYTTALGATPVTTLAGIVNLSGVWLGDPTGRNYAEHFWHSAEFRGDNALQGSYWSTLLGPAAFNLK